MVKVETPTLLVDTPEYNAVLSDPFHAENTAIGAGDHGGQGTLETDAILY